MGHAARRQKKLPTPFALLLAAIVLLLSPSPLVAQDLLEGEFGNINLGRSLIEPGRFPTLKELREAVRKPTIEAVLMLKLHGDQSNHYLPVWSDDGLRLAFQRSNLQERSSRILLFHSLADPQPSQIDQEPGMYDYMFRWARNSQAAFAFARIEPQSSSVHLYFSADGRTVSRKTTGQGRHLMPALYERTDGIWRLAYERDGQLLHEAWDTREPVVSPLPLGRGTSPRWSSDGFRLLLARGRSGGASEVAVRDLRSEQEVIIPASGLARGPVWSGDEQLAAFYVRPPGGNQPWQIQVASTTQAGGGRTIGNDVVVNPDFESEGPSFEPSGRRIWHFSHRHTAQAYYPLVAADVQSGAEEIVDYPRRCTRPADLALNPMTAVPEVVFVAHDGLPQDVFVLFLNHY
jgi:hypothetical protein